MSKSSTELLQQLAEKNSAVKMMVLLIGLPGSGKSFYTEQIKGLLSEKVSVHSTDTFFIDKEGVYKYDVTKLGWFHKQCFLAARKSMEEEVPVIIIDNTNLRARDRNKYAREAEKFGYEVKVVMIGDLSEESVKIYAERNKHGVPLQKIMQMAERASIPEGIM